MMLEFCVCNQSISRKDEFRVVSDSREYLTARFDMSDEWKEGTVALFGYGGECFSVLLDGDNCCMVPSEVIKPPYFTVSVFCGGKVFVTSDSVAVEVGKSGFEKSKSPSIPAPELWEQYMEKMQSVIECGLPKIGEDYKWMLYNPESRMHEDTGVVALGQPPVRGTDYWTEEDKTEIVSDVVTEVELGGGKFVVDIVLDEDGTVTSEKSGGDVLDAIANGMVVVANITYKGATTRMYDVVCGYYGVMFSFWAESEMVSVYSDGEYWKSMVDVVADKKYVDDAIQSAIHDSWEDAV